MFQASSVQSRSANVLILRRRYGLIRKARTLVEGSENWLCKIMIGSWFFFTLIFGSAASFSEYFNTLAQREICNVRCTDMSQDSTCKEECLQTREDVQVLDEEAGANAELRCRLDNGEAVMVHDFGFFVITQRSENTQWEDVTISDRGMWTGSTWLTTQRYRFILYRVFGNGLSNPETTDWIHGFVGDPMPVQNLSVEFIPSLNEDHDWIGAEITFDPPEDRSCIYQVRYGISGDANENTVEDERWRNREADMFRISLGDLAGNKNYTVVVQARRGHYFSTESSLNFTTPDSSDYYEVPKKVEGLNATAVHTVEKIFDVYVSWDAPVVLPDGYLVDICSPSVEDCKYRDIKNVSGKFTEATFTKVIVSEHYTVKIWAFFLRTGSGPGNSKNFTANETLVLVNWPQHGGKLNTVIIAACLVATFLVVLAIGGAVFWCIKFRKRKRNQESLEFSQSTTNEFELIPGRLVITRVLGSGAFGVVKLGRLRGDQDQDMTVAVKMLRDDTNKTDLRNFGKEIRMMKFIGKHPNIVSLLGCRTIGPHPFLVFEFCSRGDLQTFLRASMVEATAHPRSADCRNTPPKNADHHPMDSHPNVDVEIVTGVDMLNYGRQIATGMEFLASNRIVHRDLAARNVLVCDDTVVKIADFGLSRDVYLENVYKRRGNNRMPLKWMSIEALSHQVYSTYSDVWSFGILLWEIVTLGGDPYPGIPTIDILKRLQSDYRMERPATCSMPLYNVMLSCWQTKPKDRPAFTTLREELDKLICVATADDYLVAENVSEETSMDAEDAEDSNSPRTSFSQPMKFVNNIGPDIISENAE